MNNTNYSLSVKPYFTSFHMNGLERSNEDIVCHTHAYTLIDDHDAMTQHVCMSSATE